MNKVYCLIYSVVGIFILVATEVLHSVIDSDNSIIILLLYLPMLLCSLFMTYKLITSQNSVVVSDFIVFACFYQVIDFALAVIPIFVRSIDVDRLFLSNVFTYLMTFTESLFILASKKITKKRISKLLFYIGGIIYIVAMGKSYKLIRWIILSFLFVVFADTFATLQFSSFFACNVNRDLQLYLFHSLYLVVACIFGDFPLLFLILLLCSASLYIISFILIALKKDKFYIIPGFILSTDAVFSVVITITCNLFNALSLIGIISKLLFGILCVYMFIISFKRN